ncbi:cytochrome P450 [Aspergillus uvarum CBS 121591]|uniref:Cytochrome P450 n=1 Tax=Aspergillus uvarum CBS 121591 TaxID=1448315 RepID=A0A319C492_9EURO|nr:cytochrome P450 [Aspergillus uvarum CBS 121591]PYH78669.1 cytochrome P450 [Aspergillus uvarum CBS 121591]
MPSPIALTIQISLALVLLAFWRAFTPDTWPNRFFSYLINCFLLWWYPIHSADGQISIPTCPYQFPDGGGSLKFLEYEKVSRRWAEEYGPVYRIWVGLTPEIILTRAEEIKTVFRDSGDHLKASNLNGGWVMGDLVGDGVGLISQGHWKRVHAVVSPPFTQKATTYVPLVQSRVARQFNELYGEYQAGEAWRLKPAEDLKLLPFWVISDLLYGELPPDMVQELLHITNLRTDVFQYAFKGGLSLFSVTKLFSPTIRAKLRVFHGRWAEFNRQAYRRAKASGQGTACAIVPLYAAVERGQLTPTELMHTLDEALFANIDVTIGSFSWIPAFLAEDPASQEELRREIAEVRMDNCDGAWARYIASNSTLLASCINESARLRPVTNYTYAQSIPTARDVGGFRIPRGTYMVVDTNALNIRDESWGPDRTSFRPRRFLAESRAYFRYRFWRFGFGPRQCIAQALADTILKVLVAYTVEHHRLRSPGKSATDSRAAQKRGDAWFKVAEQAIILEAL